MRPYRARYAIAVVAIPLDSRLQQVAVVMMIMYNDWIGNSSLATPAT